MNVSDSEIVMSVLQSNGYTKVEVVGEADIILIFTCSIREGAEGKIWERLRNLRGFRRKGRTKRSVKIGLLGKQP